jgi:hypothetical protein
MLRLRSSSPSGRVIDIDWTTVAMVIGLVAALIATFFTRDGTAIRLLRYARPPLPAASKDYNSACFIVRDANGRARG